AIRAKIVGLWQAVAGQCRSVRSRGRGGIGLGPQAFDLAAHPCPGARPRDRGGEGQGTLTAAVRVRRRLDAGLRASIPVLVLVLFLLLVLAMVAIVALIVGDLVESGRLLCGAFFGLA